MKQKLMQYEKDLNDLFYIRKCPNDFSLPYFLLLCIPEYIISSIIFWFLYPIKFLIN